MILRSGNWLLMKNGVFHLDFLEYGVQYYIK